MKSGYVLAILLVLAPSCLTAFLEAGSDDADYTLALGLDGVCEELDLQECVWSSVCNGFVKCVASSAVNNVNCWKYRYSGCTEDYHLATNVAVMPLAESCNPDVCAVYAQRSSWFVCTARVSNDTAVVGTEWANYYSSRALMTAGPQQVKVRGTWMGITHFNAYNYNGTLVDTTSVNTLSVSGGYFYVLRQATYQSTYCPMGEWCTVGAFEFYGELIPTDNLDFPDPPNESDLVQIFSEGSLQVTAADDVEFTIKNPGCLVYLGDSDYIGVTLDRDDVEDLAELRYHYYTYNNVNYFNYFYNFVLDGNVLSYTYRKEGETPVDSSTTCEVPSDETSRIPVCYVKGE